MPEPMGHPFWCPQCRWIALSAQEHARQAITKAETDPFWCPLCRKALQNTPSLTSNERVR